MTLLNYKSSILFILLAFISLPQEICAQFTRDPLEANCADFYEVEYRYITPKTSARNFSEWCKINNVFNSIDAGISVSTMGLGLEVKTPVTKWADLRLGVDWMPGFKVPLSFNLNTFSDGIPTGSFSKVQEMLYDMTGIEMDETVNMSGRATMINFKFIVDVYPFQNNRHWHFTAGFYIGGHSVAKAYNMIEEKPTLVALNIYNRTYRYFTNVTDIFDVPLGGGNYLDPSLVERLQEKFRQYGEMGIHIGDFKDGTPYIMEPAPDGSVSAKAYVNRFKPYLGFGYSGSLDKTAKWTIGVEAGALFWGGSPHVIDQNGVNMTKDLVNVRGKVGDYLRFIKGLPVYPVVNLKISYSFF